MKAHLPKTRLPKEAPDHKQQNALSLPEIAQGNATGNSLLPPQFSLTASPTHQGKVETASEAEPDLIEHEQQGGIHANSLETPVDPPSENPKNGNGLPNDLQAVINQGLGGDFSSVEIIQNAPLPQSLGADALAQGNQIHFAPGKFDPNSPAGKELIGHEFKHIDQQRKGLVAATSQAKGLPANEDENLEKEADNFGQKVAQGSPGPDTQAEAETSTLSPASSGIAQMRLPTHASLVAMLADPNLGLSEAVIRDRVGTALSRMAEENKLITHDSVPVILGRIFPGGGVINEAAFNAVVDVTNRSRVYQNVMDTGNPIHDADKTRFIRLVERAVQVCRVSQSMDTSLERIFGTETPAAKTIYQAAGDFLENMIASNAMLDNTVTTDYNGDDPEVFSGGWANFIDQVMHLSPSVVLGHEPKESVITLIHEASHLADSSVEDLGYYPPGTNVAAFSGYSEHDKIRNAAHFEEFPRRWLGISVYDSHDVFTPGVSTTGAALTLEQKAKKWAENALEENWTMSIDLHEKMRDVRQSIENGNTHNLNRPSLLRMSQKFGLTIHEQNATHIQITDLDLVISEGVVRAVGLLASELGSLPVPAVAAEADIPVVGEQLRGQALLARSVMGGILSDIMLITYLDSPDSSSDWSDLASLL